MLNYGKYEVCGTTGSVRYVELQELCSVCNYRKCEVCGDAGSANYLELQKV
jgi:hypothetical protein